LQAVAARDTEAFELLYERHAPVLFALALKILGNRSDAEDVLQEIFLQVWRTALSYDERRAPPLGWLIMLTRSRAIDRLRSRQTRARATESAAQETVDDTALPSQDVATAETALLVNAALAALPDEQRAALELAYFGGLTQTQIAKQLRQPLGTVKTRVRTGMQRMREQLNAVPREELTS
jgi:RNA polymerase sigma-70 factor (ECF subfamily)